VSDDLQFWRCTATLPDGTRCPYPGRIGLDGAPKLCKRHAYPQGQPATSQPHGWNDDPHGDGADD
jgi:hypothetical protein